MPGVETLLTGILQLFPLDQFVTFFALLPKSDFAVITEPAVAWSFDNGAEVSSFLWSGELIVCIFSELEG